MAIYGNADCAFQGAEVISAGPPKVISSRFRCTCLDTKRSWNINVQHKEGENIAPALKSIVGYECPAPAPVPAPKCPRGDEYSPLPFQGCDVGYTRKWDWRVAGYKCFCDATRAAPPPEVPTVPVVPVVPVVPIVPTNEVVTAKCPKGDFYQRPLFRTCEPGYYPGDIPGAGLLGAGMGCYCVEGEIKPPAAVITLEKVIPEDIAQYLPIILIGAGVLILLSFLRR